MGWEYRAGRKYYYRKRREDGRVVSEYVGAGPLAELTAMQFEAAPLIERWKQAAVDTFVADFDAAGAAYDALSAAVDERVELVLSALGYRRRNGEWRRCRAARLGDAPSPPPRAGAPSAPAPTADPMKKEKEAVRAALAKCGSLVDLAVSDAWVLKKRLQDALECGEHEAYNDHLHELRALLRERPPAWADVDGHVRDTAEALLLAVTKSDDPARPAALAGLVAVREELGYGSSPALERMLIDRVALAWLACRVTDWCYRSLAFRGGVEPEHGPYWERRTAEAERRLLRASEALARTRKLVRATKAVRVAYEEISAPADRMPDGRPEPDGAPAGSAIERLLAETMAYVTAEAAGAAAAPAEPEPAEEPEKDDIDLLLDWMEAGHDPEDFRRPPLDDDDLEDDAGGDEAGEPYPVE